MANTVHAAGCFAPSHSTYGIGTIDMHARSCIASQSIHLRVLAFWSSAIWSCAVWFNAPSAALASDGAGANLPPALSSMRSFRGTITYVAREDGVSRPAIAGTLTVRAGDWRLDERSSDFELRVENGAGRLDAAAQPIEVDTLGDAWAVALGTIATRPVGAGDRIWWAGGLSYFTDTAGARLAGISDTRAQLSFTFASWSTQSGIDVPGRILRLRGGVPDASFTVSDYRVVPALAPAHPARTQKPYAYALLRGAHAGEPLFPALGALDAAWAQWTFALIAALLLCAVGAIVWTRRDGLVSALCGRMAADPRGWRRAGTSVFVDADGVLWFDGARYRVGPHFYNRAALVQQSALFVRVSAPAVPRAVVLPRKLATIAPDIRRRARGAAGFTLVETLFATALFAAIVLIAVYPAMAAIAKASAMASLREQAAVIAADALSDEETVNDYGGGAPQGTATSILDGLTLTVSVSPGTIHGESDLDITVASPDGTVLAHVTSWLGMPVQAPSGPDGGPPGTQVRP